jgi:hypothetical protein
MIKTYIPKLSMQAPGIKRITVSLGDAPWHGFAEETMWAKQVGDGLYQLRNTPFFAKGLAYMDVVYARCDGKGLVFQGVKIASRRSTYRVLVRGSTPTSAVEPLREQLLALGCTYEGYQGESWELFAWDVPALSVDAAYRVLEAGEREGVWSFEEGHFGGREH